MSCSFTVNEFEELEGLVDAFGIMRRDGTINGAVWVGNILEGLSIYGRRNEFWSGEGGIPEYRVKELQKEHGMGYWIAKFGLYGTKRIVQAHFQDIKERLGTLVPTGRVSGHFFAAEKKGELLSASSIPFEHGNVLAGVPSLMALPLVNWPLKDANKGKPAHGDYAPIIPSSGKEVLDWMRTVKPIFEKAGTDLMVDFFMHERHVIVTNMWSFDQFDEGQREAVHGLFMSLHEVARERGYGMYRGHVQHMGEFSVPIFLAQLEGVRWLMRIGFANG